MKKLFAFVLVLILLPCAVYAETFGTFFEYTGLDQTTELPALLIYNPGGETSELSYVTEDPELIAAVLDALSEITITGTTDLCVTDSDRVLTFTYADGTMITVMFEGEFLHDEADGNLTIENTEPLDLLLRTFGE